MTEFEESAAKTWKPETLPEVAAKPPDASELSRIAVTD